MISPELAWLADDYEPALAAVAALQQEVCDLESRVQFLVTSPITARNPVRNCIACQSCTGARTCTSKFVQVAERKLSKTRGMLLSAQEHLSACYAATRLEQADCAA